MSCHESAKGEYQFPSAGWAAVRTKFMEAEAKPGLVSFDVAMKVWQKHKTKGLKWLREHLNGEIRRVFLNNYDDRCERWGGKAIPDWFEVEDVRDILGIPGHGKIENKLKRPNATLNKPSVRKKNLPETVSIVQNSICVKFYVKNRWVEIHVYPGNHACTYGWGTPIGKAVTGALRTVKWTGNNGGYMITRSEYDDESDYEPNYQRVYGGKGFLKKLRKKRGW